MELPGQGFLVGSLNRALPGRACAELRYTGLAGAGTWALLTSSSGLLFSSHFVPFFTIFWHLHSEAAWIKRGREQKWKSTGFKLERAWTQFPAFCTFPLHSEDDSQPFADSLCILETGQGWSSAVWPAMQNSLCSFFLILQFLHPVEPPGAKQPYKSLAQLFPLSRAICFHGKE